MSKVDTIIVEYAIILHNSVNIEDPACSMRIRYSSPQNSVNEWKQIGKHKHTLVSYEVIVGYYYNII